MLWHSRGWKNMSNSTPPTSTSTSSTPPATASTTARSGPIATTAEFCDQGNVLNGWHGQAYSHARVLVLSNSTGIGVPLSMPPKPCEAQSLLIRLLIPVPHIHRQ